MVRYWVGRLGGRPRLRERAWRGTASQGPSRMRRILRPLSPQAAQSVLPHHQQQLA